MMSKKLKIFLVISIIVSVAITGFSMTMLWVGVNGPYLNSQGELLSDWPNAVIYEVFVRSFYDSDGDGIGDLNGLTEKLDYLQDLGIEGLWLMPINPSPSYHKYDVTDYYDIDPEYGTLEDFNRLLTEAHNRGIKILMDLVVNHTSSQHPWFKDAYLSSESSYRDWYVWADAETNLLERGEWNQQVWHGFGENHYEGIFWEGMPDLNFDNPAVKKEIIQIADYWLEQGVDGFRLDAAKHIYSRDDQANVAWWQEFRQALDETNPDVFLVGEVWAEASVVAPYLQEGLNSAFDFDLSSKILASAKQESNAGAVSYLSRVREYVSTIDEEAIDSIFLTNHDMNRIMSELNGNVNQAKMAASLLLTLPGTPFIYYGEELGMEGKKPDEQIREPMLWYNAPTDTGQTTWEKARYNLDEKAISVESQLTDPDSLYNHYKRMIYLRRSNDVLINGEIETIGLTAPGLIGFKRLTPEEEVVVLHNMSVTPLELELTGDLAEFSEVLFENGLLELKSNSVGQVISINPYSTVILMPE